MSTFCTGFCSMGEGWVCGVSRVDRCWSVGPFLWAAVTHHRPAWGVWLRPGTIQSELPSAALDVLLNDHTAVSEERAGQWLQERPCVGARVKGLHVAQGWTLAAHDASCGVDLTIQDDGTAQQGDNSYSYQTEIWAFRLDVKDIQFCASRLSDC